MSIRKYIPIIALIAFIVLFQLITGALGKVYFLTQLTMSAYYSLVAIGLCILMGYAGQISIGHAAFFAMGGYTASVLTTFNLLPLSSSTWVQLLIKGGLTTIRKNPYGMEILHLTPWISLLIAISITALVAFLIGIPILRLKGHYLAMATLGFGSIVYRIVLGSRIFGEADGISEVPAFNILPQLSVSGQMSMRVENYYIAWFVVVLGMVLLLNLINSRVGRALRSIHGSEDAANSMGVNTARYKLFVFVLSAVFASIGGVLLAHYNGGIGPSEAGVMKSVRYVAIVAVGGMANLWGALIMGVTLNFLSLRGYFGSYDDAFFGIMLILIMLFAPDGILRQENINRFFRFLGEKWKIIQLRLQKQKGDSA
jgi:branched-chain amino acid transport system permease protein